MRRRSLASVSAHVALLLVAWPVAAQEKETRLSFEGPEVFCHVLHQLKLQPVKSFDLSDAPAQSMVILFGNPAVLNEPVWTIELDRFAQQGGSILIATDHPLDVLGVRVPGSKVVQSEGNTYGGEARCPLLSPQAHEPTREHPIFLGLNKGIATNCPSHVRIMPDSGLVDLLNFPVQAKRTGFVGSGFKRPGFQATRPQGRLAYIAGTPVVEPGVPGPAGRTLVIAGHGVFMNGMMLQTDNANFDFAVNVVRWLRDGPDGKPRTQALFVVDGVIIEDFDMNLAPPAPPLPTPTVTMLNRLIRGLEDERFFHHMLGDVVRGNWNRLLTVLLSATTLLLVLYGAKKMLQGRLAPETSVPSMAGAPVEIDVASAVNEAREQAVMRQPDFAASANIIIQQWFQREFGIDMNARAEIRATGGFWARGRLNGQAALVQRLMQQTAPVNRREFFLLIVALQDLTRALQEGEATLLIDGKIVRQMA